VKVAILKANEFISASIGVWLTQTDISFELSLHFSDGGGNSEGSGGGEGEEGGVALGSDGGTFPGSSDWWGGCGGLWSAVFLLEELLSICGGTGWGNISSHAAVDFVTNFFATSSWAFLGLDGSIDISLGGIWSCAS
jgi:hypothetical protein